MLEYITESALHPGGLCRGPDPMRKLFFLFVVNLVLLCMKPISAQDIFAMPEPKPGQILIKVAEGQDDNPNFPKKPLKSVGDAHVILAVDGELFIGDTDSKGIVYLPTPKVATFDIVVAAKGYVFLSKKVTFNNKSPEPVAIGISIARK